MNQLQRYIYGKTPVHVGGATVGMTKRDAERFAVQLSKSVDDMIARELDWIARGVHPSFKCKLVGAALAAMEGK